MGWNEKKKVGNGQHPNKINPVSWPFKAREEVEHCERTLRSLRPNLVLLIRWFIFRKSFSNLWYVNYKSNIWPERCILRDSFKLQFIERKNHWWILSFPFSLQVSIILNFILEKYLRWIHFTYLCFLPAFKWKE